MSKREATPPDWSVVASERQRRIAQLVLHVGPFVLIVLIVFCLMASSGRLFYLVPAVVLAWFAGMLTTIDLFLNHMESATADDSQKDSA